MGPTSPRAVVADTGALIALERGNEYARALFRRAAVEGARVVIPAGALAQAWRDGGRQARLAALVRSAATQVEDLDEAMAKAAGALCGRAGTADVVDASVVLTARAYAAVIVTSDADDLRRLDPRATIETI